MNVLKKVDTSLYKILEIFCVCCMIGLFTILILKVFFRMVPILSFFPSVSTGCFDEIIEWLFAWLIMTCSTLLCRKNEHFRVDLLSMKLKGKPICGVIESIAYVIALAFYILLLYYGVQLCSAAVQTTPLLRWPKAWFYFCIPFNSALMCVYTIRQVIVSINKIKNPEA